MQITYMLFYQMCKSGIHFVLYMDTYWIWVLDAERSGPGCITQVLSFQNQVLKSRAQLFKANYVVS